MEQFTVAQTVDTELLRREGYRAHVRDILNQKAYDEIIKILSDQQRHLLRVTYREEEQTFSPSGVYKIPSQTVFFLELEVGTVHIHQYEMHVHDFSAEPMWKVTRSAIDELKYRIRSRWRRMRSRK